MSLSICKNSVIECFIIHAYEINIYSVIPLTTVFATSLIFFYTYIFVKVVKTKIVLERSILTIRPLNAAFRLSILNIYSAPVYLSMWADHTLLCLSASNSPKKLIGPLYVQYVSFWMLIVFVQLKL